jgi:hypothetical protein
MVPSYIRKGISGWINYSCRVTSHKISENEMDYRGSKSVKLFTVKEQRVDDSYLNRINLRLRCTLTGFESSYQFKILSKQLKNHKTFSTINTQPKLNSWFVTGFFDAESSFIFYYQNK